MFPPVDFSSNSTQLDPCFKSALLVPEFVFLQYFQDPISCHSIFSSNWPNVCSTKLIDALLADAHQMVRQLISAFSIFRYLYKYFLPFHYVVYQVIFRSNIDVLGSYHRYCRLARLWTLLEEKKFATRLVYIILSVLESRFINWVKHTKILGPMPLPLMGNLHQFFWHQPGYQFTANNKKKLGKFLGLLVFFGQLIGSSSTWRTAAIWCGAKWRSRSTVSCSRGDLLYKNWNIYSN